MGRKSKADRFNGLPVEVVGHRTWKHLPISIEVYAEPEHIPYEGNCSAIDPETDRNQEAWIRHQLDGGNHWAWCQVTVLAEHDKVKGYAGLGGCSYLSADDFCKWSGYLPDLVREAIEQLLANLAEREKEEREAVKS